MLRLPATRRPAHTGIPALNLASRFADRLRVFFPLNGQPYPASLHPPRILPPTIGGNYPVAWNGSTLGLAFDGFAGSASTGIVTDFSQLADLNGLTAWTVAFRMWTRGAGENSFGREFELQSGNIIIANQSATDINFVDPSGNADQVAGLVTTFAWYDIVFVFDSGVQKTAWANGKKFPLTTRTGTISITTQQMFIGNRSDAPRAFDGFLADVGLWTYAWPDDMAFDWANPSRKYDIYWQPNTRAYSFMSAAASAAGYLLVKN